MSSPGASVWFFGWTTHRNRALVEWSNWSRENGPSLAALNSPENSVVAVSLRHDLHALSPLFKYGIAHNWCRENPVTSGNLKLHGAKMPSDADAVRIHVLTRAEEMLYFHTCLSLRPPEQITVKSKPHVQTRNGKRFRLRLTTTRNSLLENTGTCTMSAG
jgi:hypothetical protein